MTDRHPTPDHYVEFDVAFTHFNHVLFEGGLPPCLITMSRRGRARGYFKGQAWQGRGQVTDEISLSPDQLGAPTLDTLAVLVHEMTHQWQAHFGAPSRSGYHNREWGARMEALGLIPSDTGRPGGKRTGQIMGHYVSDGGPFEQAAKALARGRLGSARPSLSWSDREPYRNSSTPARAVASMCGAAPISPLTAQIAAYGCSK